MRIGIVTGEYPPMQGGVGAYTAILAEELVKLGHEVHICTRTTANKDLTQSRKVAKKQSTEVHIDRTIERWNGHSLRQIKDWATRNQLEVVNLQFQTAAFDMSPWIHALPDALRPLPIVTTFHDLRVPYLFPKAGKLRDWIIMRLAKQSTGVIVTNHEDHQRLQSLPHRALIPIGSNIVAPLEQVDRSHWRQQAHAADGDFLIAYFGLANATKGIDTLIAGLSQLRGQGIPAHLVMIGSVAGSSDPTNQAFSAQLNAIIQRSNMNTFIHQTGFIPDEAVGVYLTAADVVALPFRDGASFRRGSLMAPIHYGCAIVTTTPGVAIPEFVNGENLLLVPSDNADALALALKQVYDSAALRDRLKAGATALRPLFDWGSIARRTADYLRQVAQ